MAPKKNKIPARMLPQNQAGFDRYKTWKYKLPFPDEYKKPAKALMQLELENIPLESTINPKKNPVNKNFYKIAVLTLEHDKEINYLINKLQILKNNKFLKSHEAKVLIAELLWGKQFLKTSNHKVEAIKFYEEDLREAFIEAKDICNPRSVDECITPVYIRINTLAISINDVLSAFCKEGWHLLPRSNSYSEYLSVLQNLRERDFIRDYHISELLAFPAGTKLYNHPGYVKGKFIYQDKGSCLSSFLLNPKPNSIVLDVCAAPGKKTNHLVNIMDGTGLIYAIDIHPERVEKMKNFLGLTETNAKILKEDFINFDTSVCSDVKYILIDPTCSYSGIFFSVGQRMKKLSILRKQFNCNTMLRIALQKFPNVKRVVYTTCSVYTEECEEVIDQVMKDVGNSFTLLNVKEMLWNEWANVSQPGSVCEGKCLRIVPEYDLCQGYFIAVFERNFDVPIPPYEKKIKAKNVLYSMDELEKVEKVTRDGRVIEKFLPKLEADLFRKKQEDTLKNINNHAQLTSKQVFQQNQPKMKYVNPNFKKQSNFPTTSATVTSRAPPFIFETTHSQLYP